MKPHSPSPEEIPASSSSSSSSSSLSTLVFFDNELKVKEQKYQNGFPSPHGIAPVSGAVSSGSWSLFEEQLKIYEQQCEIWRGAIEKKLPDAEKEWKANELKIEDLSKKIIWLKKFPNQLFQLVEKIPEFKTNRERLIQDQKLFEEMRSMLSPLLVQNNKSVTQKDKDEKQLSALLNERNIYGETILLITVKAKCYLAAAALVEYMNEEEIIITDTAGRNLLHIISSHSILRDSENSIASLCDALRDKRVIRHLLWQYDMPHEQSDKNYPLHYAVHTAARTQHTAVVKILLSYNQYRNSSGDVQPNMLQMQKENGDSVLHLAIQEHKATGLGLPIIEELLQDIYEFPLRITNYAGRTVFDLTQELIKSDQSLRGQAVMCRLRQAEARYRERLQNWGWNFPSCSLTDEKNLAIPYSKLVLQQALQQALQEVLSKDLFNANEYQDLYNRYQNLYEPIITNKAELLFSQQEKLEPYLGADAEYVGKALDGYNLILRSSSLFLDDKGKAIMNFFSEIKKRIAIARRYLWVFLSTAPEITCNLSSVDSDSTSVSTQKLDLVRDDRHLFDITAVKESLLETLNLAKKVISDEKNQTKENLRGFLAMFGLTSMKAELISCINWQRIDKADQLALIGVLFGHYWPTLTLRNCEILAQATPSTYQRRGKTIWEALFKHNAELQRLEITGKVGLQPEHWVNLAIWCPKLRHLILKDTDITVFYSSIQFIRMQPIFFPSLKALEFNHSLNLTSVACKAPRLVKLNVEDCSNLKTLRLDTPRLGSIGCRGAKALRELQTKDLALVPLKDYLKSFPSENIIKALYQAAGAGQLAVVRWIMETTETLSLSEEKNSQTPIHIAAEKGQISVLMYLLSCRAFPLDGVDKNKQTALHFAMRRLQPDVVRTLCAAGLSANLCDIENMSPLDRLRQLSVDNADEGVYAEIENRLVVSMVKESHEFGDEKSCGKQRYAFWSTSSSTSSSSSSSSSLSSSSSASIQESTNPTSSLNGICLSSTQLSILTMPSASTATVTSTMLNSSATPLTNNSSYR